tara:strand:- start:782 stop:2128 length:1347 start_codon:yes stop_codon:yes gene_type:complete
LFGSYLFYGWWDWRFLGLILFLTLVNFYLGLKIEASLSETKRKRYLACSIVISVGVLATFKYANFFIDSFQEFIAFAGVGLNTESLKIILPVGISFYTFQAMSYTIDLYRKEVRVEQSLLKFATYIAFFPQLVAGPIVRASEFLPQLGKDQQFSHKRLLDASCIIAWGLILKVVVADSLALVVDIQFQQPLGMSSLSLLIGIFFYAFQIYGDFSGYSLMAIGFAHFLGFEFKRNFDRPYFADSFSNFWERWHISLSSWLRDYIYIPLGGNRKGARRTYLNLMFTMLLGGLWHGAAWSFVLWGALHAAYLCVQRITGWQRHNKVSSENWVFFRFLNLKYLLKVAFVFMMVCVAWVFFRAHSFSDALTIINRILLFDNFSFESVTQKFHVFKGLGLILTLYLIEWTSFRVNFWSLASKRPILIPFFLVASLLVISVLGTFGSNAFIYFQF